MIEDVNDHSPVFQNRAGVTVMEDEPVGYPIIHVIATDADSHEAGRVTYSIVSGNEKGHFVLDSTSGKRTTSLHGFQFKLGRVYFVFDNFACFAKALDVRDGYSLHRFEMLQFKWV